MDVSAANHPEATSSQTRRGGAAGKIVIFAAKLVVTGACFWYISRQIDLSQALSAIRLLDFRWAALGLLSLCSRSRSRACVGGTSSMRSERVPRE